MALLRLRGSGGDGGVYPLTHAEMKWMTPSEMGTSGGGCHSNADKDRASEGTARFDRARSCAASSKVLKAPIVVCDLGHLLNKEDLIEQLLAKSLPPHLMHIRSLKNVHDATLHPNPAYKPSAEHLQGADDDEPPFYCPIAMIPMNGRYPFAYIQSTGQVVSQRALKQVGGRLCPISETPIGPSDMIPINPTDEERKELQERLAAKKALAAEAKRKAKEGAGRAKELAAAPSSAPCAGAAMSTPHASKSDDDRAGAPATFSCASVAAAGHATSGTLAGPAAAPGGAIAGAGAGAGAGAAAARVGKDGTNSRADGKRPADGGEVAGGSKRQVREWERVVQAKASESAVYKSLFISAEERRRLQAEESANFCARGIVPSLSRSTKFGLG